jgi:hypothetical protein
VTGWLVDGDRRVDIEYSGSIYRLKVERAGSFLIDARQQRITVESRDDVPNHVFEQVLVGPPLIYLMACLGTVCLHASAVTIGGAAAVFLGVSGAGKSTLAAAIHEAGLDGMRRLCDDIVPVGLAGDVLEAYPRYPQLKLAPGEQAVVGSDREIPVRQIYLLERGNERGAGVDIERLDAADAALALIRHTIASRLFDDSLVAAHLDFAARASAVQVARLLYPDGLANLPKLIDWLDAQAVEANS